MGCWLGRITRRICSGRAVRCSRILKAVTHVQVFSSRPDVAVLLPGYDSEVAGVLGRAFVSDPPLRMVVPQVINPVERADTLTRLFAFALKLQRLYQQPVLGIIRDGRVVAAALSEVAHCVSTRTMTITGFGVLQKMLSAVGSGETLRAIRLAREIGKNRPQEPHLYRSVIGVDPGPTSTVCSSK
jgi:hypothetical protein